MHPDPLALQSERSAAAQAIARDVLRRRTSGDEVSDADVLAAHDDLRAELQQELRKLAVIGRAARGHAHAGSSAAAGLTNDAPIEVRPDRFPGYRVVREIARGGQGAVFEAIQDGTRRRVAIKLIHRGGGGARDSLRFAQEVRILAHLRHPNVITIHESGSSGDDDYFVMDYVEGVPLDQWIAERLSGWGGESPPQRGWGGHSTRHSLATVLRETLELFATICEAVHAAHLRGVIHRDLKPANIRVTYDGHPVVLDFGLAKRLPGELDDMSITQPMTDSGHFVGSLPWASPEQAAGRIHEIDLRTDVYSLGVMLYQAIAGRFPYEVRGPLVDVIGRILNSDAAALSRSSEYPLAPLIDRDLEAIALRCLSKPRERRYQGAGELAADLRRYLAGQAIDARRDSTWYVFRKTLRRHRVAASIAAAFVALTGASAVVFAVQAGQIRQQRDEATAARDAEHVARVTSDRIRSFLEELIGTADPFSDVENRRDITLLDAVNLAEARIAGEFGGEPLVEASVRTVIGRTYRELGALAQAEQQLHSALLILGEEAPQDDPRIAAALHEFAVQRQVQTRFDEAEEMCREALRVRVAAFGSDSPQAADSLNLLAHLLRERSQLEEAEAAAREALAVRRAVLGNDDPAIAESLNALAGVLRESGQIEEAESAYVEALDRRRAALGANHPDVATSLNNLATLRCEQKRFADAIPLLRDSLDIYIARLGEDHPYLARARANLATALVQVGSTDEAEAQYREAIRLQQTRAPDGDADTAVLRYFLAKLLIDTQREKEARPELEAAVALLRTTRGDADGLTRRAAATLVQLYDRTNEADRANDLRAKLNLP